MSFQINASLWFFLSPHLNANACFLLEQRTRSRGKALGKRTQNRGGEKCLPIMNNTSDFEYLAICMMERDTHWNLNLKYIKLPWPISFSNLNLILGAFFFSNMLHIRVSASFLIVNLPPCTIYKLTLLRCFETEGLFFFFFKSNVLKAWKKSQNWVHSDHGLNIATYSWD